MDIMGGTGVRATGVGQGRGAGQLHGQGGQPAPHDALAHSALQGVPPRLVLLLGLLVSLCLS